MSMVSGKQPRRRARMSMYEEGETYINPETGREEIFLMGELRPKYPMGKPSNSGEGEKELPVDELPRNVFPQKDEFPRIRPRGFGGDIPSPRQSYETPSRRPSSAGGDRDAMIRAYMARIQPEEMGSTVPGEGMNKPAMDINDAFFGPDRKRFDIVEFITNLIGGK